MRLLLLSLCCISSLSNADTYGLTAPGAAEDYSSGQTSGYGLIPTEFERSGSKRATRLDTYVANSPSNRAPSNGALNIGRGASATGYGPTKQRQPVSVGKPNMQHFAAGQASAQTTQRQGVSVGKPNTQHFAVQQASASRYSSGERVSRKQYDINVTGHRDLAQVMRAPIQFASAEPLKIRSLQAAGAPSTNRRASLQSLRTKVAAKPAAASGTKSVGPASLQGLKARLKKPKAAASDNSYALASAAKSVAAQPAPARPNLAKLKSKLKVKPTVPTQSIAKEAVSAEQLRNTTFITAKAPKKASAAEAGNSLLDSLTSALGVVDVKPWQKSKLAQQSMKKGGAIPSLAKFSGKVFISKEATRGGQGVAGGGCGCN